MKYYITVFLFFWTVSRSFGQCPYYDNTNNYKKDTNWQLNWADSFNYTGQPDPSKWKMDKWGEGASWYPLVLQTDNGYNAKVNDSFLSLTAKKGSYAEQLDTFDKYGNKY